MELESKPGFEKTVDRFEAWWKRQIIDRPPVSISIPSGRAVKWPGKQHATLRDRWMDLEYRIEGHKAAVQSRKWIADSIPCFHGNLGPEILATLYGAELEFTNDSSWSKPILHASRDVLKIKPDLGTQYWAWERKWVEASLREGAGQWITCVTDLHTHADLLAALREPQELLLDLMDDYDGVKKAIQYITPLFDTIYDEQANAILKAGQPVMSWAPCPHRGRGCILQADFICMISPEMFQDIFLPALQYEVDRLDCSIYHLDGPNALQHLDALLEMPRLNAIQWIYGAGNGPASRWIDVYKRIQAAGKGIQIVCEKGIEDALAIAEQLKPEGIWFDMWGNYSEDQVNAFLKRMERWAATGKV